MTIRTQRPRPVPTLSVMPDGRTLGLRDTAGEVVPDATPLTMTAAELTSALLSQLRIGHQAGTKATAAAAARVVQAAATAGAIAGTRRGVEAAFQNSTSVRRVVRDERGDVAYTVEERIPITTKETSA
jgi:hypothetical protein